MCRKNLYSFNTEKSQKSAPYSLYKDYYTCTKSQKEALFTDYNTCNNSQKSALYSLYTHYISSIIILYSWYVQTILESQHYTHSILMISNKISSQLYTHYIPNMLQVISHKKATNYRALLRKMTYEDKASYDSTTTLYSLHTPLNFLLEACCNT